MNTETKYLANLNANINLLSARRREIVAFIAECTRDIEALDKRKRSAFDTMLQRIERAKEEEKRIRGKIASLDDLEAHVSEIAELDDAISIACQRRRELTDNDRLHTYLKGEFYGY